MDNNITVVSSGKDCNIELTSVNENNIIASHYSFKDNSTITIIKEKNHILKMYVFKDRAAYESFDFGKWKNENEIYNSLKNESIRSSCIGD